MFNNNKILVVIPARGGSKGIPRKNIRLLGEKPLISYAINTAKSSQYVDDVVITTEDPAIATMAEKFGCSTLKRPVELSGDEVPLDPVIYDAVIQKEKQAFDEYDLIVTLQPTSPLLKTATLDAAIEKFRDFDVHTVVSVVDDRHLRWGYDEANQRYFPLYRERVNRQYLPKSYKETGSLLITRRGYLTEESRFGENIDIIETSTEESIDIDTYQDWWIAENYLNKRKIAIVVNAYDEIGTGHIYRCLSIASKLVFDDVVFILNTEHQLGIDIVKSYNYPYIVHDDKDEIYETLNKINPHIVINDILDTSLEYITKLKEAGYFVINFEDLGEGIQAADLVFDALYEHNLDIPNVHVGREYYILKDEFFFQNRKIITNDINNVLITFGGTDPNNLTEKALQAVIHSGYDKTITVILGMGYPNKQELIDKYSIFNNIIIYENVNNMSEHMFKADIILTSAGRTMYEVCSIGVPCICLCQNEREQTHVFGNHQNGFMNLGLGRDLSIEDISKEFGNLVEDYDLRTYMNQRMLSIDLRHGFENIQLIIRTAYSQFERRNDNNEYLQ